MSTLSVPSYRQYLQAVAYLASTKGHECAVCEYGDCTVLQNRGEAYTVVGAYRIMAPIRHGENTFLLPHS